MSGNGRPSEDRRARRTRAAVVGAFNRLFLGRRRGRIGVAEIAREAEVGRSTLYEHFGGAHGVLLEALKRPFGALADAAAGHGDPAALAAMLAHFWENRQRAPELLTGREGERVARLLSGMVEERLAAAPLDLALPLAARMLAESALAPIRLWLLGEAPAAPAALADAICRSGRALRAALAPAQVQSAR